MVEPVSLGVIVASLIAKFLDRAEDGAVDAGAGVLRRLTDVVRGRVAHGSETGEATLERVQDAPDSPSRVRELAAMVDELAERDSDFRLELDRLVSEAYDTGIDVRNIVQTAIGDQNAQIAVVTDSQISVSWGGPPPSRPSSNCE